MSMPSKPPIEALKAIMVQLRDPASGCEWDREQSFETIAPYTIEEAYEVADAIAREDMAALRDELGDLLLQVVFHSRMAEELGHFAFDDVAAAICAKLVSRHPHIFGGIEVRDQPQRERWEDLKARERSASGASGALDGVALSLPALLRAEKLQKRAARAGFDWPDAEGPEAKVREELEELAEASPENRVEEAGDLLFAAVNLLRKHDIAPEDALRAANAKFERRFKAMEALATSRGQDFTGLDIDAQEALWQAVKRSEAVEASKIAD